MKLYKKVQSFIKKFSRTCLFNTKGKSFKTTTFFMCLCDQKHEFFARFCVDKKMTR